MHVFEVHDDSVWALAADSSFSHFFSGSRDGSVFATDLATSKSVLLFSEPHPILKVRFVVFAKSNYLQILHSTYKGESLWVTTTDPSIKKWVIISAPSQSPPPSSAH